MVFVERIRSSGAGPRVQFGQAGNSSKNVMIPIEGVKLEHLNIVEGVKLEHLNIHQNGLPASVVCHK